MILEAAIVSRVEVPAPIAELTSAIDLEHFVILAEPVEQLCELLELDRVFRVDPAQQGRSLVELGQR